jgi:hypothetical protein
VGPGALKGKTENYVLAKGFKRSSVTTTTKIGRAMINSIQRPDLEWTYLENKQINALAEKDV